MRRLLLTTSTILGCVVLGSLGVAHATEVGVQRPLGVGLVAGSSPGLTLKIWTRPTNALDLGVGFGLGNFACSDRFNPCGERNSVHADYLWQSGHGAHDHLSLHAGLGARVWFWDYGTDTSDFQIAARAPVGLDLYIFRSFEGYGEIAPSLAFGPSKLFLEGALGARLYL
jgi:hypothetical protein